jgi:lysophospholipase L1-like esterase
MRPGRSIALRLGLGGVGVLLVAAAAALFAARMWYASRCLQALRSPRDLPVPVQQDPGSSTGRVILLMGDSRVAQWGVPRFPGYRVVNAGIPGATTPQLARVAPRLLAEHHPSVVFVQAGINDLKLLGVRPDMRSQVVEGSLENLERIAREARGAGAEVLVSPVWPTGPVSLRRRVVWSDAVDAGLQELNARMASRISGIPGVRRVDLFAPAPDPPGWPAYLDTLHLAPAAYGELTARLAHHLPP